MGVEDKRGVAEDDSVFYFGWMVVPVVKRECRGGAYLGEKVTSVELGGVCGT